MPHTPGPWEYRNDKHGIYVCSVAPNAPSYGTEDRPVDLLEDGTEADHRLMAAAPALLAALKLAREMLTEPGDVVDVFPEEMHAQEIARIKTIDDAIASANF